MTNHRAFDVCVIGAGPGGYAAAMRAHDLGKRVALVERSVVGGAGLHMGALSSKTLWHLSNDYAITQRHDRGYRAAGVEVSYPDVIASVRAAVDERRATMVRQLGCLSEPSPSGGTVTLLRAAARFTSPTTLELTAADGARSELSADRFVIATGSTPRVPEGIEIDGERVVTSDHIESWPSFPENMVIVGAGVIGCEYATIFGNFGRTKIHIIDRQPRILPFEDEDVAEVVARAFEAKGVVIHRQSKLESLAVKDGKVEYVVTNAAGQAETIRVERALVSIGRVPNTRGLGLEAIGVEIERSGNIVSKDTQTTVPHIYAAGDVTMDIALVNIAELEGRYAVESMFGLAPRPIRYEALSAIMFLSPEVASVGLNETQARAKGVAYRVAAVDNSLVNRNVAMRSTAGFVKLLATPDGKVLGLRVVGPQASSAIQGIAFLIDLGGTLDDIDHCVHPHPAITEGVQECARVLLGKSVHKREVFAREGLLRCADG
ncbi:MAG: NAD(P)/FAD-dependent oxidoreductase [Polyangiaceae bacterium]